MNRKEANILEVKILQRTGVSLSCDSIYISYGFESQLILSLADA